MKKTLIIAFNGGAYGTYLEWVLNTLITNDEIQLPFTHRGNSHDSKLGHHLGNIEEFRKYVVSNDYYPTGRLHPKTEKNHSLTTNLDFLLDHASHVILLYPAREHELLCVCNYMTKIWQGNHYDGAMAYINPDDIYQGYNIPPGTDLRTIPIWIQREHMSFNLFDSWHDQVEWYFPDRWQDDRAMVITTKDLFDDFTRTLSQIEDYWHHHRYRKSIHDMLPWHNQMIGLQKHLGKDKLCEKILLSITDKSDEDFEFGDICLISQAWIQYQLRQQEFELACHDLNTFPTNTNQLRSLVYRST